jgi:hypothetical protein
MTYQRDPNPDRDQTRPSYIRRDDGSWGMVPVLILVVALLGLGYFAYNRMNDAGTHPRSTTTESTRPATTPPATTPTTPPATTPAPTPAPKQP